MGKLIVSLSPHAHGTDSVERNMYGVIIALLPALLVSFFYFGIGSAIVCLTSVAACVLLEWAINRFILGNKRNTILDGSAALTGLLLGMNLPSNLPVWIIIIGALFAIGVGKMTFGGIGNNIFNPALVGRCVLLVAFPAQMTSWPLPGNLTSYTDAETGATPLALMKEAIKTGNPQHLNHLPDAFSMLLGDHSLGGGAGTIGEICGLALLVGFAFMLWRKIITWHIPVSIIGTAFARHRHPEWWTAVGCYLHGYRLRHLAHDTQRSAHLWCVDRYAHHHHPLLGCLSRGYVVCHSHHECLYTSY